MKYSRFKIFKRRRSQWEIYDEMLDILIRDGRPTHLMYGANISFKQKEEYLHEMEKMGLVKLIEGSKNSYEVTDNGKEFRKRFDVLLSLLR
jgi:predicted transcriptional regulator